MYEMGRRTWASISAVMKSAKSISASDLPGVKSMVALETGLDLHIRHDRLLKKN